MTTIRAYNPADAFEVGKLIQETYSRFNLSFLPARERGPFLGPFRFAAQPDPAQLHTIHNMISTDLVLLAEDSGMVAGVLRGRIDRLGSLFVYQDYQGHGVGRSLVEEYEGWVQMKGGKVIRVAATLYAVPFYQKMGYKKSTGVRKSWSFEGYGLPIQPMRKVIK